jgi:hypothetical protein
MYSRKKHAFHGRVTYTIVVPAGVRRHGYAATGGRGGAIVVGKTNLDKFCRGP